MRKRTFLIMLLPIVILLWAIGWSLFWTGSETNARTTRAKAKKDNGIEIVAAPLEEITVKNQ
jgi:flagellar basal body-associated protein FliL